MKQCEFCSTSLPDYALFCGKCGRAPSRPLQHQARLSNAPGVYSDASPTLNDASFNSSSALNRVPRPAVPPFAGNIPRPVTLIPLDDENEEQRRRKAIPGIMGPLLVEQVAGLPMPPQPPVIAGTPPMPQSSVIPNTLPTAFPAGNASSQASSAAVHASPPPLSNVHSGPAQMPHASLPAMRPSPPIQRASAPPAQPRQQGPQNHRRFRPHARPHLPHFPGWLSITAAIIAAVAAIIGTTAALGATVFAPGLSLNGSSTVVAGGELILHGHNFLPDSMVALSLDHGLPIFLLQHSLTNQLADNAPQNAGQPGLALQAFQAYHFDASNTISTGSDGTFSIIIPIQASWAPGKHTISATETVSHRSTSLAFTIALASATATPAPSPTTTATDTPTPTPSPAPTNTPTPTPTTPALPPTLSCANPTSLALGPLSELSSQLASLSETLCTSGSGQLTWKATWDHTKAPWLQLKQSSGSVQAPNPAKITVSASAATLQQGTYTATITFTGGESTTTKTVTVTLTVKKGCVLTAPQSLSFTGVATVSKPAAQNVTITNCGLTSDWSAKSKGSSSWLGLSASKGSISGGKTQVIAISADNLKANLAPGTYADSIFFTIGTTTSTVTISLIIQAGPPAISVTPTSLNQNGSEACGSTEGGGYYCNVTLTNSSSTQPLTWSFDPNGSGARVSASSNTIAAGGTESVTISLPKSDCGQQRTFTFSAPGNSVNVFWTCSLPPTPTPSPSPSPSPGG